MKFHGKELTARQILERIALGFIAMFMVAMAGMGLALVVVSLFEVIPWLINNPGELVVIIVAGILVATLAFVAFLIGNFMLQPQQSTEN